MFAFYKLEESHVCALEQTVISTKFLFVVFYFGDRLLYSISTEISYGIRQVENCQIFDVLDLHPKGFVNTS